MKIASIFVSGLLLGMTAFAHKQEPVHEPAKPYYVVIKGIHNYGDHHGNEKGDHGNGIGIDLGYRLGHGFAVEIDGSYEKTNVTVFEETESVRENIKYWTSSLDFAYTYEATESLGILFKVGYEYEYEKTDTESSHDTGLVYAAGFEYAIDSTWKVVGEYEKSTIKGPKGDMITLGVMYNFDL
ncbi:MULTISPECIES: porin family protein [unclassified Nitratiruptor]|uniref:porin family protein n=1 Tax=unclassified Nitratiruptor TaxID=2624044 RepID=UPI0019157049|nr:MULTISPECIES: porin family protein [unclassified Nitratiruptor]BCD61078.1 hypothetical protein NitYY0810_C1859 [Nitratiruptor sp. YY08-10]BCD65011.1 hypothetical protein NitYY0814_C1868 [Nitratiruptor sp. YY08-14]